MPELPKILFRDARFVVLDKPAGLAVHAGPRGGRSVEDFFPQISRRRDGPWLAHRLDADTAGCLVVALRKAALIAAQAEFSLGRAHKIYWAVVQGAPDAHSGTIDAPLVRQTGPAGWRMIIDAAGQRAVTDWRVLGRGDGIAWLEFSPRTGRTHQIRVHAALLGCPILGEPVYGVVAPTLTPSFPRTREPSHATAPIHRTETPLGSSFRGNDDRAEKLHLLARAITLDLDPPVTAQAEPPEHMHAALARCGYRASTAAG